MWCDDFSAWADSVGGVMIWHALQHAAREARDVVRARTVVHLHLRQRLLAALTLSVIVDAVGSALMYLSDRSAAGTAIHTPGDAVFWVTTQLLTISSQMSNPITPPARIVDVALQFYAMTVVSAMAGAFGAFFYHRSRQSSALPDTSTKPEDVGE